MSRTGADAVTDEPYVDLAFPIRGTKVPRDHGYLLFSALASRLPELHEADWLLVHPLTARRLDDAQLILTQDSVLTMRVPAGKIPIALRLSGSELRVGSDLLQIGVPTTRLLQPVPDLFSLQVAIRLTTAPRSIESGRLDMEAFRGAFSAEAERQLRKLATTGRVEVLGKRTVAVKGQRIVAFSVAVRGLMPEDSIRLQAHGLGGKHRMGCGVFVPCSPRVSDSLGEWG